MWSIYYKASNDSQEWRNFGSFEDKAIALTHAFSVSHNYFLVKVTAPDDSVIWCN